MDRKASSFGYGWINVIVASLAMTATLPGRTHGLGLITQPLLADLGIDAILFAQINFVATIAGALFCVPIGWWIDRRGVRGALTAVTFALGVAVVGMSLCEGVVSLSIALVLVRGLGQGALSLVSFTLISRWYRRRLGPAMGVFAVLLTIGFVVSVLAMGSLIQQQTWRVAWGALGWVLIGSSPLFWLLARDGTEAHGGDGVREPADPERDVTLREALRIPAFWFLILGTSLFNLVWSGLTLFNQSILAERGMDEASAAETMAILAGIGLVANLIGGVLIRRNRIVPLMSVGLFLLAIGLWMFPRIDTVWEVRYYAIAIGSSGGLITVVFFAAWRHLFGRGELGRIQSLAQAVTVLASAAGPWLIATSSAWSQSYTPIFQALAGVAVGLVVSSWLIRPAPAA